jgi:RNA polymerase sigma-70 factor, ECF subfamily
LNPKNVASGRSPELPESGGDSPPARAEDPDRDDVQRVLAGDSAAYGAIVSRHHKSLVRVLTGIVCDRHLAEDVAQEIWWITYRRLESFGFRARFRTWLHRIAVRKELSARTRFRRLISRHETLTDPPSADTAAAEKLSHEVVRRALSRLPATERAAFALHLEGFSYDEIAVALDRPPGTIATHLHRARARLAEWIRLPAPRDSTTATGRVPTANDTKTPGSMAPAESIPVDRESK